MSTPKKEELPQVQSVTVHYHGGGKIALEEYGKLSAEYGASVSRVYAIPDGWSEDMIRDFELEKVLDIRDNLDPLLQQEYDNLLAQRRF